MSEGRVERRLAAILAVDVAGYSRLMGEDEEGTLGALRAVRREPNADGRFNRGLPNAGQAPEEVTPRTGPAKRNGLKRERMQAGRLVGTPNDRLFERRRTVLSIALPNSRGPAHGGVTDCRSPHLQAALARGARHRFSIAATGSLPSDPGLPVGTAATLA